jgi:hypothetical protein
MSQRAHFWLRIVGITTILAAQFGPRVVAAAFADGAPPVPAQEAQASAAAR